MRDEADLVEQVRTTVLHELGHHFGMSEDDLDSAWIRIEITAKATKEQEISLVAVVPAVTLISFKPRAAGC